MDSNAGGGRAGRYYRPPRVPPPDQGRGILGAPPSHPQQHQQQRLDVLPRNHMRQPRLRPTQPQQDQHRSVPRPAAPGGHHQNQRQGYRDSNAAAVLASPQGKRGTTFNSSPGAQQQNQHLRQGLNPQGQGPPTVNSPQAAPATGGQNQRQGPLTVNSPQAAPATVGQNQRQGLNPQRQGPPTVNSPQAAPATGGQNQRQGHMTSNSTLSAPVPRVPTQQNTFNSAPPAPVPPAATQPQSTVEVPNAVVMELKLPPHIEETNLQYMFDKEAKYCVKEGVHGYVQFSSQEQAEQAKAKWCILEKIVQPKDKNSDLHIKRTPYGAMPIKVGTLDIKRKRNAAEDVLSGQTKDNGVAEKRQRTDVTTFRKLRSKAYDWCSIAEYSKEDSSKEIVRAYKFTAAAKCGSVSPHITLCSLGPIGHIVFPTVCTHLFSTHLSGRTFRGNISTKDIAIERNLKLCAILKRTYKLEKASEISDDILSVINSLEPLYKINGSWPPYYIEMIDSLKKPPANFMNIEELSEFHSKILEKICFATLEMKRHLLEEFHGNYKNLQETELESLDKAAPKHLEDWRHIPKVDKLVGGFRVTGDNLEKFGKEAQYMRHLLVHSLDLHYEEFKKEQEELIRKQQEEELKKQEGNASVPSAPLAAAAPARAKKALVFSSSSPPSTVAPPAPVQPPLVLLKLVLDLLERDMLVFYYFRKFWPAFIDFMFERRSNHPWLNAMCDYYSKSMERGVILHETIELPEGERSEDTE